jgi:hypothetical protein
MCIISYNMAHEALGPTTPGGLCQRDEGASGLLKHEDRFTEPLKSLIGAEVYYPLAKKMCARDKNVPSNMKDDVRNEWT